MKLGYVPEDKNSSSVSKTLEYAYDDWAIAQAAKKLGRNDIYDGFIKRSENWKNVYDASTGFTRPKIERRKIRRKLRPAKDRRPGIYRGQRVELQPLRSARSGGDDRRRWAAKQKFAGTS